MARIRRSDYETYREFCVAKQKHLYELSVKTAKKAGHWAQKIRELDELGRELSPAKVEELAKPTSTGAMRLGYLTNKAYEKHQAANGKSAKKRGARPATSEAGVTVLDRQLAALKAKIKEINEDLAAQKGVS